MKSKISQWKYWYGLILTYFVAEKSIFAHLTKKSGKFNDFNFLVRIHLNVTMVILPDDFLWTTFSEILFKTSLQMVAPPISSNWYFSSHICCSPSTPSRTWRRARGRKGSLKLIQHSLYIEHLTAYTLVALVIMKILISWVQFGISPLAAVNVIKLMLALNHGPLSRYVKLRVAPAPGMPGAFPPAPWVNDPTVF